MNVAIFDIDGTLTDTMDVDMECFVLGLREELGLEPPTQWHTLSDVTDSTIVAEACRIAGRGTPDPRAERRLATRVGALLAEVAASDPGRFLPIPGAADMIDELRGRGWRIGLATGAWRPSAEVKLETAALPVSGIPLVTSSDFPARAAIIAESVRRSGGDLSTDTVVYFGDGEWDGRAAEKLGCHFVGIGAGRRAESLIAVGARHVTPDFTAAPALMAHLDALAS